MHYLSRIPTKVQKEVNHKRKFYKQGYIEFKKTGNVVTVFLGALTLPHTIID